MNQLLTIIAVLIIGTTYAQIKREDISTLKVENVSAKHSQSIDLDKKDTLQYVNLGFRNAKNTTTIEISTVMITDNATLYQLIKDLEIALPEIKTKNTLNWHRETYSLAVYSFSKTLILGEPLSDKSGSTQLTNKSVEKLIAWLKTIKLNK